MPGYSAEERRALERAVRSGEPLVCPVCGEPLTRRDVAASPQVSYVRRRVWLLCPGCKRTGAVDAGPVRGAGPP